MDNILIHPNKKIKLEEACNYCVLCNKCAVALESNNDSEKKKLYVKVLLKYLVPLPRPCGLDVENLVGNCNFCKECHRVLAKLCQLRQNFKTILESITAKVNFIKISILKAGVVNSGDPNIAKFKKIAVKDFRPVVSLHKNNVLHHRRKTKENAKRMVARKKTTQFPCPPKVFIKNETETSEPPPSEEPLNDMEMFTDHRITPEVVRVSVDPQDLHFYEDVVKFEPWTNSPCPLTDFENEFTNANYTEHNDNRATEHDSIEGEYEDEDFGGMERMVTRSMHNQESESEQSESENIFWKKPALSMTQFAILAIKNGPTSGMSVHDIITFITENFPYYRSAKNWKFLLRKAVTCNSCFVRKAENNGNVVGSLSGLWTVNDSKINESFRMRIVETCEAEFVANPERLAGMLRALLIVTKNEQAFDEGRLTTGGEGIPENFSNYGAMSMENMGRIEDRESSISIESVASLNPLEFEDLRQEDNSDEDDATSTTDTRKWLKPSLNVPQLIILAMANTSDWEASVSDIYQFLVKNYPYFNNGNSKTWRQYISNALCHGIYFIHVENENNGIVDFYENKRRGFLWTVDYDQVKHKTTKIAEMAQENLESMAHPENLNSLLQPLFKDKLSYDHLIFATLKNAPREAMLEKDICEYIRHNFWPYCKRDSWIISTNKMLDRLKRTYYYRKPSSGLIYFSVTYSEAFKMEIECILKFSPAAILNALTKPDMVGVIFRNVLEDFNFSGLLNGGSSN